MLLSLRSRVRLGRQKGFSFFMNILIFFSYNYLLGLVTMEFFSPRSLGFI